MTYYCIRHFFVLVIGLMLFAPPVYPQSSYSPGPENILYIDMTG